MNGTEEFKLGVNNLPGISRLKVHVECSEVHKILQAMPSTRSLQGAGGIKCSQASHGILACWMAGRSSADGPLVFHALGQCFNLQKGPGPETEQTKKDSM